MEEAAILRVEVPLKQRIDRLIREYAHFDVELLKGRTEILRKKLGGQHATAAIEALDQGDYKRWIEIVLVYYDKTYGHSKSITTKTEIGQFEYNWECNDESFQNLFLYIKERILIKNELFFTNKE
jgi:hypothetical protein